MNLEINNLAYQIDQDRRDRRVVREYESLPRTERHPVIVRFGLAVSRFGHRLQGISAPAAPELRPCPECGIATW
jgi:hypothetical protein